VRVFVAGASGAIGRQLVPLLLAEGHEVTGMTRSPATAAELTANGATGVVADALDAESVATAVADARPEAVVHELTALPARIDPRKIERDFVLNDRLRTEGTRHLIAAAQAVGVRRIVAQSIAFTYAPGPRGRLHEEGDPLIADEQAAANYRRSAAAVRELERRVLDAGGLVLRYGYFYGPGTALSSAGSMGVDVRKRRMPIVGHGAGVWSLVHIGDAARATVAALERGASAAYNIVDDHPAPVSEWLPGFASALGAPRPMRVPKLIARLVAGSYGVAVMTEGQGASNELAKRELQWQPRYPSWRDGFAADLG
jgi:nucleoside-diphosphate-sugar epimerase